MSKSPDTTTPVAPIVVGVEQDKPKATKEETNKAHKMLVQARVSLLFNHAFFGQLALRLKLLPVHENWCRTAATDGKHFYYDPLFVLSLSTKENVFLVAHELGHCIYEHFMRRGGRNPKLWNIAGDYIINNMVDNEIVNAKEGRKQCAERITTVNMFLDHDYDGWTTEELYDKLMQDSENGKNPEEDGELLDVHINMHGDDQKGDEKDGEARGAPGGSFPAPMSDEEREQLSNQLKDAILQAAQAAGAGNVPGDIKRMISELLEPQMDWREIIRAQIESSLKSNYTWLRRSRKAWHIRPILPGMDNDFKIDVVLAIDTSGSISQQMLTEFISEVAGIMEQYEEYRIQIFQFDTKVYGYKKFESDDAEDITTYQIEGGGGTDFEVCWKYMKDNDIEPDQFIMFTDGQPYGSWGDEEYCDTVFLINTTYGKPVAPFGQTVYYEES